MADVAQKAINANIIRNNRSVVSVNPKSGQIKTKDYGINKYVDVAVLEARLDNRLNQVQYYSN